METYQNYKGYGISYYSYSGITEVRKDGIIIKEFTGIGEFKGNKAAREFIDNIFKIFQL